ncbi:hypothetical protein N2152v2_010797 [Parachlorella kessleri]
MSWAAIARSEPAKVVQKVEESDSKARIAVVDANAIINGEHLLSLMRFNEKVVTVPEVLKEVRDKQSRQTLQSLPYTIHTQEPAEESVKAVLRFARATGDVHALSAVDVRLLALAHTLEVAYYGSAHLREQPPPPKLARKKVRESKYLPGWGAEGGEWAELDKLNEDELAAAEAALMAGHSSRINTAVQQLTLGGSGVDGSDAGSSLNVTLREPAQQAQQAFEGLSLAPPADGQQQPPNGTAESRGASTAQSSGQELQQGGAAAPSTTVAAGAANGAGGGQQAQQQQQQQGGGGGTESEGESGGEEEEEEGGGWETAARTKNKQRRRRRREIRYAKRQAEEGAGAVTAATAAAQGSADEEHDSGSEAEDGGSNSEGEEEEEQSESEEGSEDAGSQAPLPDSAVCSVTADFAMQNVLLQMGLRLVTPDGRRVSQLSRWVLRCAACFAVTKEMGRLFCPKCGNASLDKVRVVVGPDGAEQYGVRKKHILRGTKFSLPKPKGGRYNDVILREDQLLAKMHRLRKKKGAQEELDPFAPEYTDETWHQVLLLAFGVTGARAVWAALVLRMQQGGCSAVRAALMHEEAAALPGGAGAKGAAALLAGWKHNPNERKHVATNRRRK